jgi:hypothetical protein
MVAKCSNPACNRPFRELSKGRLFLLPPHDYSESMRRDARLSDYCYWLCPECEATHTITRCGPGSEVVVTVRELGSPYPAPAAPGRRKGPGQISLRSYMETG